MKKYKLKNFVALLLAIIVTAGYSALFVSCSHYSDPNATHISTTGTSGSNTKNPSEPPSDQTPPALREDNPALIITEVMVNNSYVIKAPDGEYRPWIELYAKQPLTLSDYSLKYADSDPFSLPDIQLEAGEYYLLFPYSQGFDLQMEQSASLTLMHGELISQSFVYASISNNCSFLVDSASECTTPTPGYENALPADQLMISELMCDNTAFPVDGVLGDWIEIFNSGDTPIELSSYFISDKSGNPYLSRLPELTLEAKAYTLLRSDIEISFGLSGGGEVVTLTRNDGVICSVMAYDTLERNCSQTAEGMSRTPSPGYPNSEQGMLSHIFSRKGLIINEVLSSNSKYKALSKEYYDIVELYNNTDAPIELGDYYLTDKSSNLTRYKLPDKTLGAGKYYLVYCTGNGGDHPEFSISSDGEDVILTRSDGFVTDALNVPYLTHNVSYGRADGVLGYFDTPTLGFANGKGLSRITVSPVSSTETGKYNGQVSLTLSGEGRIYYTTDGTKPNVSSKLYSGEVITLSSTGSVRAFAVCDGCVSSPEVSYTYVVTDIDYSLPVIAVSVDNESVFGENGVNSTSEKTELDARVAYFVDGKEEFSLGCGFKIFGGMTRFYVKKSFQLKFRGQYGSSTLDYKVFDDIENTVFNSLVLRAGGQSLLNSHINDELGTSLASTSGNMPSLLVQAYKPVNFYINDTYMGVYFMREKIDEEFVATHLGVSPESCTVIDYMTDVKYGEDSGWKELWEFVKTKDLTVKENYEYILSKFDIDSLIDFYVMSMWANNTDCGNVRVARSTEGDGKWRFILFDMDMSCSSTSSGVQTYLESYHATTKPYNALFWKLLKNDTFREYFDKRFEMHLSTTLSPETVNARIDYIYGQIAPDMPYEIERWKDLNSKYNQSMNQWEKYVKRIRDRRATEEYITTLREDVNSAIAVIRKEK